MSSPPPLSSPIKGEEGLAHFAKAQLPNCSVAFRGSDLFFLVNIFVNFFGNRSRTPASSFFGLRPQNDGTER